jgi:hypothetical protein
MAVMLSLAATTLCLAYVSWRFVEQPFRKVRWGARSVVLTGAVASIGLVALGCLLVVSGIQKRAFIAALSPKRLATLNQIESVSHRAFSPIDDGTCRFGVQLPPSAADAARITSCAQRFGPGAVIFGDSHAENLQRALLATGEAPPFLIELDKGEDCDRFVGPHCLSGALASSLIQYKSAIGGLIYEQAGFYLLLDSSGRPSTREIFWGHRSPVASPNLQAISGIAAYLDELQIRLGVPVVWVGPWLEPYFPMERFLGFDCQDAPRYVAVDPETIGIFANLDIAVDNISKGHRYRYVSAMKAIDFDSRFDIFDCSNIYWNDGDHFSVAGETRFGKRLSRPVKDALSSELKTRS